MWSLLIGLLNISSVTIISPSIRSNESSDDGLSNTTITIIACAVGGGVVLLIVLLERKRRKLVMGENQHAEGLGEKDYILFEDLGYKQVDEKASTELPVL